MILKGDWNIYFIPWNIIFTFEHDQFPFQILEFGVQLHHQALVKKGMKLVSKYCQNFSV